MIQFVQQPTHNTCTSACLSMITGIPVADVISDFHNDWVDGQKTNPSKFLLKHGFEHSQEKFVWNNNIYGGHVYLLTVPSLNIVGGMHHIIFDANQEIGKRVFDPIKGRPDKTYYVDWIGDEVDKNEVKLSSWVVDLEIEIDVIKAKRI